jgi:hypothetical protein
VGTVPEAAADSTGCDVATGKLFTHHYTDLDLIELIDPTIVTSGNWLKNRQYHKVVTDADNQAPPAPVYTPADAVAVGITHYAETMHPWDGDPFEMSQFDVRFEASCGVSFWFDHLEVLAEPFASLAPAEPVSDTRDAEVPIRVEVRAGTLIGHTSGTVPAHTWDFVVVDPARTNRFANQERYVHTPDLAGLLHGACPPSTSRSRSAPSTRRSTDRGRAGQSSSAAISRSTSSVRSPEDGSSPPSTRQQPSPTGDSWPRSPRTAPSTWRGRREPASGRHRPTPPTPTRRR